MSSTKISPRPPIAPAWTTSETASGIVMKYRVISGCVTVTGPPRSIWRRKIGITLPEEPRTLPKRTATKRVGDVAAVPERLDDPLADAPSTGPSRSSGSTALSVETSTKRSASNSTATSATTRVASDVVAHGLDRVRLHQRHVLVRRGVEDDRGLVALEDLAASSARLPTSASTAAHGGEAALVARARARSRTARVSALLDEDEPRRAEARDLAAELRADRAAGAGDEHASVRRGTTRSPRGRPRPARGRARPRPARAGSARRGRRRPRSARAAPAASSPGSTRGAPSRRPSRARSPGADGIAISTSSGRCSRRIARQVVDRAEHADPVHAQVAVLRGSSSTRPIGV